MSKSNSAPSPSVLPKWTSLPSLHESCTSTRVFWQVPVHPAVLLPVHFWCGLCTGETYYWSWEREIEDAVSYPQSSWGLQKTQEHRRAIFVPQWLLGSEPQQTLRRLCCEVVRLPRGEAKGAAWRIATLLTPPPGPWQSHFSFGAASQVVWMWLGRGIIKGAAKYLICQASEKMKTAFRWQYTALKHDPVALCKAPEEPPLVVTTGFLGERWWWERNWLSGWNASDPRLCPGAFSRGAPRRRG